MIDLRPAALQQPPETEMQRLTRPDGVRIAYHQCPAEPTRGAGRPGVVFLGGFMSDMSGTKALYLEALCAKIGLAYVRLDYQGHGRSDGAFTDGTIGRWAEDALAVIGAATEGPQILVGSSMGGWIMLLAARALADEGGGRVAGLVGIAPAPDFTEDLMWERYDAAARRDLLANGIRHEPSEYSDEPYAITLRLIEDGRNHLLLRDTIPLECPVRILHGQCDDAVPWQRSLTLAERLASEDVLVTVIKDGDHRLSRDLDLARLGAAVAELAGVGM